MTGYHFPPADSPRGSGAFISNGTFSPGITFVKYPQQCKSQITMQFIATMPSAEGISARDQKHGMLITKASESEGHLCRFIQGELITIENILLCYWPIRPLNLRPLACTKYFYTYLCMFWTGNRVLKSFAISNMHYKIPKNSVIWGINRCSLPQPLGATA